MGRSEPNRGCDRLEDDFGVGRHPGTPCIDGSASQSQLRPAFSVRAAPSVFARPALVPGPGAHSRQHVQQRHSGVSATRLRRPTRRALERWLGSPPAGVWVRPWHGCAQRPWAPACCARRLPRVALLCGGSRRYAAVAPALRRSRRLGCQPAAEGPAPCGRCATRWPPVGAVHVAAWRCAVPVACVPLPNPLRTGSSAGSTPGVTRTSHFQAGVGTCLSRRLQGRCVHHTGKWPGVRPVDHLGHPHCCATTATQSPFTRRPLCQSVRPSP